MKMNLFRRYAMNFPFRDRDALKYRLGFLLYPIRKPALCYEFFYLREIAPVFVIVRVRFVMMVSILMLMLMSMFMILIMLVSM